MATIYVPSGRDENEALMKWACDIIRPRVTVREGQCMAIISDDRERLYGVVVFHNYMPDLGLIEATVASRVSAVRWGRPDVLAAILHYPFRQLRVRKLIAHVSEGNAKAQALAKHLGLTRECLLRHHYGHKDHAIMWSMMAREYERSRYAVAEERIAA